MIDTVNNQTTIWIACIGDRGARLFRFENVDDSVKFHREIPNDDGAPLDPSRLVNMDQDSFLDRVTQEIDGAVQHDRDDSLILCADHGYIDLIREHLRSEVQHRIIGTVSQDLYDINESDLYQYVKDIIEPEQREIERDAA